MTKLPEWKKIKYMFPNCEVLLHRESNQQKVLVIPPECVDTKQFCETIKPYVTTLGLEPEITTDSGGVHYIESEPIYS